MIRAFAFWLPCLLALTILETRVRAQEAAPDAQIFEVFAPPAPPPSRKVTTPVPPAREPSPVTEAPVPVQTRPTVEAGKAAVPAVPRAAAPVPAAPSRPQTKPSAELAPVAPRPTPSPDAMGPSAGPLSPEAELARIDARSREVRAEARKYHIGPRRFGTIALFGFTALALALTGAASVEVALGDEEERPRVRGWAAASVLGFAGGVASLVQLRRKKRARGPLEDELRALRLRRIELLPLVPANQGGRAGLGLRVTF